MNDDVAALMTRLVDEQRRPVGRPKTKPEGETRLANALRNGTYEHLREQLTELVTVSGLSHAAAGSIIGYSKSTTRFICQVLDIRGGYIPTHPLGENHMQVLQERALVRVIRRHCPWDRGW